MKYNSNTRNMVDGKKFKIASLAVALSAALITTAHAEDINYDGSKEDSNEYLSEKQKWMPGDINKSVIYSGSDNSKGFYKSSGNTLNIANVKGSEISAVFGGASRSEKGSGKTPEEVTVKDNIVTIDKVENFSVYGGYINGISHNSGGTGDYTNKAIVENNTVNILGDVSGENAGKVLGIDHPSAIYGGYVNTGNARYRSYEYASNNNSVNIGGNVSNTTVVGGSGSLSQIANGNIVTIGGNVTGRGQLGGGFARITTTNQDVVANNNFIEITGNVEREDTGSNENRIVFGGYVENQSNSAENRKAEASSNTVIIKGNLKGDVVGGYATINDPKDAKSTANSNTVTLGGDIQGKVSGGQVAKLGGSAEAINNIITITANKNIGSENTEIYGARYSRYDSSGNISSEKNNLFTGNTLKFSGYTLQAKTIANFEHYKFTLDPRLVNTETASITAEEIRLGNGRTGDGAEKSQISVVDIKKGNLLYVNDRFVLMDSDNAFEEGSAEIATGSTVGQQGISILYEIETIIDYENGKVTAVVKKGAGANPQLKSLSEGHLASLMQLTRAADMVAYEALDTIKAKNNGGLSTFFKFGGGHSRYDSGSHIKANDYHIMAGVSLRDEALTAAAFVEGGWGNYDTHNSFQGLGLRDVNGDGKNRYIGVGVIGQYDFADGLYVDGSFRIGSSHNKFNAVGLRNETEAARYSFSRTYVSAHAGLGYLYDLDNKNAIDFSAKYLWTHIGGKTLSVAGEKIKFNSLDSNRIRLSATWNHQYSDSTKFKAGAGYEYEFSAKAKGTALDIYSIDAPKVKGGTGILTLGMNINPEANKNVDIDFNINGYAGKRDGVSASIKVGYNF